MPTKAIQVVLDIINIAEQLLLIIYILIVMSHSVIQKSMSHTEVSESYIYES